MHPPHVLSTTADYATASGATATVTYAAQTNYHHIIYGIAFSYSGGTLSGGNIQIKDGSNVIFNLDVLTENSYIIPFYMGLMGSKNSALTVVLANGSSGVVGKVNVLGHLITKF